MYDTYLNVDCFHDGFSIELDLVLGVLRSVPSLSFFVDCAGIKYSGQWRVQRSGCIG